MACIDIFHIFSFAHKLTLRDRRDNEIEVTIVVFGVR